MSEIIQVLSLDKQNLRQHYYLSELKMQLILQTRLQSDFQN